MKQSTQILKILDILSTSSKGLGVKKSSLNKKGEQEFESLLTDTDDKLYSVNSSGIILENPPSKAKNILNLPFSNTSPDNSEIIIGEAKISAQENLKVGVIKSTQKSDIISPQNGTRSKLNSLNFASNQRKNTEPIKVSKGKSNLVNSKRLILNKDSAKELIVGLQKDDKQKIVNDLKIKTKLSAGASKAVSNKEGSVVPIDSMKKVIAATGGMKAGEKNEEVVDVNPLIKS